MKWMIIGCVFLTGCMNQGFHLGEGQNIVQTLPLTKQKQRIAILQKKLEIAQRNLNAASGEVEQLASEIQQSQLTLVEKQIETFQQGQLRSFAGRDPFTKEREILQQIQKEGPSPEAFEAKVMLDRMSRMKKG